MEEQNNFISNHEDFFIYFSMGAVDSELSDDLSDYLYENVVNARNADEVLYIGHGDGDFSCDVIRYKIQLENATRPNIDAIKNLLIEHTNTWVASKGGKDSVI